MSNKEDCCFAKILKVIDLLQRNVERFDDIDESCTKPFLGGCSRSACFNTRPVTFYTCQNTLFTINFQDETEDTMITRSSSVFRVEKVDGCCVTVLILKENPDGKDKTRPFVSTGQFATINLDCVCVLKCLPDVIVDCL